MKPELSCGKPEKCEFEGMKLLGTFCYNPQAVFPIYFVMRVNKTPLQNRLLEKTALHDRRGGRMGSGQWQV